jgi:hypothetical protein
VVESEREGGYLMSYMQNVPVMMRNTQIGTANVHDDGRIVVVMTTPDDHGQELYKMLEVGMAFGISIAPVVEPAVQGPYNNQLAGGYPN